MHLSARLSACLVSAVLAAVPVAQAQAAPPVAPAITAIGDSYIAGVGSGPYIDAGGCRQSTTSYPRRIAAALGGTVTDLSCPGATVADASLQADRLDAGTSIVIVEVGGNDAGFSTLAGSCIIGGEASCASAVRNAQLAIAGLDTSVTALIARIRSHAPSARVILTGYPALLESSRACTGTTIGSLLGPARLRQLIGIQRGLDAGLRRAAQSRSATFVDWPTRVDQHSVCSPIPWFVLPGSGALDDLLHPTSPAVAAMAQRLTRLLGR